LGHIIARIPGCSAVQPCRQISSTKESLSELLLTKKNKHTGHSESYKIIVSHIAILLLSLSLKFALKKIWFMY